MSKRARKPQSSAPGKLTELFSIDLRSLAFFRIALASVILLDMIFRSQVIQAFYTDAGVFPRSLSLPLFNWCSINLLNGSYAFQAVIFLLTGIFGTMLLVGYRTRLATIACYVLLTSIHARNLHVVNACDDWLRAMMVWSIFLPLGARWSLDARRSGSRQQVAGPTILSAATIALLVQFSYVYLCAGFTKNGAEWHSDRTAVQLVLSQSYWVRPFGEYLAQHPALLKILSPGVVYFEIAGALLLFLPWFTSRVRLPIIAGFWMLQLGFGLSLQVNLFPLLATAGTLPFIPSVVWDQLARLTKRLQWLAEPQSPTAARQGGAARRPAAQGWLPGLQKVIVSILIGWVVIGALTYYASFKSPMWRKLQAYGYMFGLSATWNMYAEALPYDFDIEAMARLEDGTVLDLHKQDDLGAALKRTVHSPYNKLYLDEISTKGISQEQRKEYIEWLAAKWNTRQPPERHVNGLRLIYVQWDTLPPGPRKRVLLGERSFVSSP